MGKQRRTRGRERKHLEAVDHRCSVPVRPRPFDVVVDGVVIGGHRLEGGRMGLGERAARRTEDLTGRKLLECPGRNDSERARVKRRVRGERLRIGHASHRHTCATLRA